MVCWLTARNAPIESHRETPAPRISGTESVFDNKEKETQSQAFSSLRDAVKMHYLPSVWVYLYIKLPTYI